MKSRRVGLMSGYGWWVCEVRATSDGGRNGGHVELLDPHRRNERGAAAIVGFAGVNRHGLADEREIVVADERGHVPAEVLHGSDDLAVLDQEQSVAGHAGVEQRLLLRRYAADVPEEGDEQASARLTNHVFNGKV